VEGAIEVSASDQAGHLRDLLSHFGARLGRALYKSAVWHAFCGTPAALPPRTATLRAKDRGRSSRRRKDARRS